MRFTTFIERSHPDGDLSIPSAEKKEVGGFRGAIREYCAKCRREASCAGCVYEEYAPSPHREGQNVLELGIAPAVGRN